MDNIHVLRDLADDAKVMAVLKADAYGAGMREIARAIFQHVDYYAVAYYEEGVSLRHVSRLTPILIFIYDICSIRGAAQHDLTMTISNMKQLIETEHMLENTNYILSIHLAVNTGMNRYGFDDIEQFNRAIRYINVSHHLKLTGIYSHLFDDDIAHNTTQVNKFNNYIKNADSISSIDILKHISATHGIIHHAGGYDTVRIGLGMYVGNKVGLVDAVSLYSRVQSIRYVKRGEFVGYSCNYSAKCDIMVAVVYGGYADGLDRRLTGLDVFVEGKRAKIIGAICMDVFFVDVTDIDDVHVGSEVTIIGGDNTISRVAQHIGITEYELLTSFHGRVTRSYNHARGCEDRGTQGH